MENYESVKDDIIIDCISEAIGQGLHLDYSGQMFNEVTDVLTLIKNELPDFYYDALAYVAKKILYYTNLDHRVGTSYSIETGAYFILERKWDGGTGAIITIVEEINDAEGEPYTNGKKFTITNE